MTGCRHRIFLVPPLGRDVAAERGHWEERHGLVFGRTPGLLGYRQNRPVAEQWRDGTARFCSETWFADREEERAAYRSDYYRDVVTPDESGFLDRDAAWSAVVVADGSRLSGPSTADRLIWFGADPPAGPRWQVLELDRPVPPPGIGTAAYVATLDRDLDGLPLIEADGPVALMCRPVDLVRPPVSAALKEGELGWVT